MKLAKQLSESSWQPQAKCHKSARTKGLGWVLSWLLILLFLWWALQDIQFANIWNTLKQLNLWQILVLLGLNATIILIISGRWWLLLRSQRYPIALLRISAYRLVAFGISYFTPGPQFGGEPAQVYYLKDRHQIPVDGGVASVSLDKILELLANFTFLLFGIYAALQADLLASFSPIQAFWIMVWPLLLLLAYSIALWAGFSPLARLLDLIPARYGAVRKLHNTVASAEKQIGQLCRRKPVTVLSASLISLLVWGAMLLEYWLAVRFLGAQLNLAETIIAVTAARISFLFPLPGGLGILEASQVLVMQSIGYDPALGFSISLLMRARDIALGLTALIVGLALSRHKRRIDTPAWLAKDQFE